MHLFIYPPDINIKNIFVFLARHPPPRPSHRRSPAADSSRALADQDRHRRRRLPYPRPSSKASTTRFPSTATPRSRSSSATRGGGGMTTSRRRRIGGRRARMGSWRRGTMTTTMMISSGKTTTWRSLTRKAGERRGRRRESSGRVVGASGFRTGEIRRDIFESKMEYLGWVSVPLVYFLGVGSAPRHSSTGRPLSHISGCCGREGSSRMGWLT